MTPAEINKPLHLFIYIGGAVLIDKIFSKTNHMQISFCFPASYFLLSCCLHAARNTERSGYCGENADRNLNHHFPSILLHRLLLFRDLHCRRHRLHCRYCRRWYPGHQWFRYRQLPAFRCLQFRWFRCRQYCCRHPGFRRHRHHHQE